MRPAFTPVSAFLKPATVSVLVLLASSFASANIPETVIFGGDAAYPPLEWNEEGIPQGFHVDLARAIATQGGVQIEHRLGDWPSAIQALESGSVDVVPMFWSVERAQKFLFTPPFFSIDHAIYAREGTASVSSAAELEGSSVAVEESSYAYRQLQKEQIATDLSLAPNTLEALRDVMTGKVDYALLAALPADHLIRLYDLDLRRTGPPFWSQSYAFAVSKDQPQLARWLTDNLNTSFTTGRYDAIYQQWEPQLTPSDRTMNDSLRMLGTGMGLLAILAALGFGWSWTLSRTVTRRTQALSTELALRRKAEEDLFNSASYDVDSNLPNARYFTETLTLALPRFPKSTKKQILLIQLAELSRVVGTLGYGEGRSLVRDFGDQLQAVPFELCGHLGRDVFAVVADKDDARKQLETLYGDQDNNPHSPFHMHVGTATWPDDAQTAAELMRRAETALAHGMARRQIWVDYHIELEPDPIDLQIVREFRVSQGEGLHAVFQPQQDLVTGLVIGAEALVRWDHPELGTVSPAKFIPLLEHAGLIGIVTERMINEAVRVSTSLRRNGTPCPISVNVSASDLLGTHLVDTITMALGRFDGLPGDLKIELTETSVAEQPDLMCDVLQVLRELGVATAVDDFGTGYASLSYLSVFPVQEVKIDQMFIRDMLTNARNFSIVRSTISMGGELGLTVVAEGIEDQETLEALRAAGCDCAQGFWISRPLDETGLARYLCRGAPEVVVVSECC